MKKLVYVIVGLVVVYFILCLFGPSVIKTERSISINVSPENLKKELTDLKSFHDNWSPWTEKDPEAKVSYTGEIGQPGSTMSWESNNKEVGKGAMVFDGINGDSILETLKFDGMGNSKVYHIVIPENAGSKITWGMTFPVGFFGRAVMLFMNFDKMMAPDYEKGLSNLKNYMESKPQVATTEYTVEELTWEEEKNYVGKKETVAWANIPAFFSKNLPAIFSELEKNKIQPTAAPSGVFFSWDEANQKTDMAAVIGVAKGTTIKGLENFTVPANSKVLHVTYFGAYDKTQGAYAALDNRVKEKSYTKNFVVEEYVNDPMEKDTAKWQTEIYMVLK